MIICRFAVEARPVLSSPAPAAPDLARLLATLRWAERLVVAGEALLLRLPGHPALAARLLADALCGSGHKSIQTGLGLCLQSSADATGDRSESVPGAHHSSRPEAACRAAAAEDARGLQSADPAGLLSPAPAAMDVDQQEADASAGASAAPAPVRPGPCTPGDPDPGQGPVALGVELVDGAERALVEALMQRRPVGVQAAVVEQASAHAGATPSCMRPQNIQSRSAIALRYILQTGYSLAEANARGSALVNLLGHVQRLLRCMGGNDTPALAVSVSLESCPSQALPFWAHKASYEARRMPSYGISQGKLTQAQSVLGCAVGTEPSGIAQPWSVLPAPAKLGPTCNRGFSQERGGARGRRGLGRARAVAVAAGVRGRRPQRRLGGRGGGCWGSPPEVCKPWPPAAAARGAQASWKGLGSRRSGERAGGWGHGLGRAAPYVCARAARRDAAGHGHRGRAVAGQWRGPVIMA